MDMQIEERSLGEIARNLPGATRLFRQFQMDFCCGGARTLREEAVGGGYVTNEEFDEVVRPEKMISPG